MKKDLLTTGEVSKRCRVTHRTVLRWIEDGELEACSTPGGHRRILTESFLKFLTKYNIPLPSEFRDRHSEKVKILIVDDDETLAQSMKRAFSKKRKQFEIDVACDGFDAGKKIAEFKPAVVLLDMKMPKIDGFEVAKRIRNDPKTASIVIIAMSGYFDDKSRKRIRECGANVCLDKPFDIKELVAILERLL